jgi:hypothetical protein
MRGSRVFQHNDSKYIILDQRPIHVFAKTMDEEPNMEMVQVYMKWRGADHVLRTQTHFLFCETIQDAILDIEE